MGPLLEDPLWISMSAGMATDIDAEKDIIAQLADVGWAMEQTNTPPRVWVTTECQKADFEPRVCLHIGGPGRPAPARGGRLAVAVLPGLALAAASDRIRCFSTRAATQNHSILLATSNAALQGSAVMAAGECCIEWPERTEQGGGPSPKNPKPHCRSPIKNERGPAIRNVPRPTPAWSEARLYMR